MPANPPLDHLAIVQSLSDNAPLAVQWVASPCAADLWLAQWMRDNRETRPANIRCTVAKCLFTIND